MTVENASSFQYLYKISFQFCVKDIRRIPGPDKKKEKKGTSLSPDLLSLFVDGAI